MNKHTYSIAIYNSYLFIYLFLSKMVVKIKNKKELIKGILGLICKQLQVIPRRRKEIVCSRHQRAPLAQLHMKLVKQPNSGSEFMAPSLNRIIRREQTESFFWCSILCLQRCSGWGNQTSGPEEGEVPFSSSELGQRKQRLMSHVSSGYSDGAVNYRLVLVWKGVTHRMEWGVRQVLAALFV